MNDVSLVHTLTESTNHLHRLTLLHQMLLQPLPRIILLTTPIRTLHMRLLKMRPQKSPNRELFPAAHYCHFSEQLLMCLPCIYYLTAAQFHATAAELLVTFFTDYMVQEIDKMGLTAD